MKDLEDNLKAFGIKFEGWLEAAQKVGRWFRRVEEGAEVFMRKLYKDEKEATAERHRTVATATLRAGLNEDDCLFSIRFYFFVQRNLYLFSRKVNLHAVIAKRVKFDKKSFWTISFDFFVQFGEFVQLDVPCPMKPKQTTQT